MARKKYYSLTNILKCNADYNIIIGERSNGKTFATLEYCFKEYWKSGREKEFAYIRRWKEDVSGRRAEAVFAGIVAKGLVKKITAGEFTTIKYYSGKYYLANYDEDTGKIISDGKPFCYNFALSEMEHDKSTAYPKIQNIIFDEFISRMHYLKDEFILFMNVLSTIIRDRQIDKIFLCGNTVNKYNPYFEEFGIKNELKQGAIDVYEFGKDGAKIALEYCDTISTHKKESNKYFAFNNSKLKMITKGAWELDIYPHLPAGYKINHSDIIFSFVIVFNNQMASCDVVENGKENFIFIHWKTTEIRDKTLVFDLNRNVSPYYRQSFRAVDDLTTKIRGYFTRQKVFYQSNEVGELVANFIKQSEVK